MCEFHVLGHEKQLALHRLTVTIDASRHIGFNLHIVRETHTHTHTHTHTYIYIYTGCPRRNVPDFGRVFLMLKCTDITQNTYVHS